LVRIKIKKNTEELCAVARAPPPANDEHSPKRQRTGGPLRVQELMDLKQLLDLSLLSLEEFANLKARLLADT
jgi:hypothetical protein